MWRDIVSSSYYLSSILCNILPSNWIISQKFLTFVNHCNGSIFIILIVFPILSSIQTNSLFRSTSLADNILCRFHLLTRCPSASLAEKCVRRLLWLNMCASAFLTDNMLNRIHLLTICASSSRADNVLRWFPLLKMCAVFFCWQWVESSSVTVNLYFGFSCWKMCVSASFFSDNVLRRLYLLTICASTSLRHVFLLFELTLSDFNP